MDLTGITKERAALVFIEFQREWLGEDGLLRRYLVQDLEAWDSAAARAGEVLAAARQHGWPVAHAGMDLSGDDGYALFGGGRGVLGLRAAIPYARTWQGAGAAFVSPFEPQAGEFVVKGRSGASVLKNSTLDPFLRNNGITTLFLMGFATHVCVESTLREAHDIGYNAVVVEDGCAAFEAAQHAHVRDHVVHHFGGATTAGELVAHMAAA